MGSINKGTQISSVSCRLHQVTFQIIIFYINDKETNCFTEIVNGTSLCMPFDRSKLFKNNTTQNIILHKPNICKMNG